MRSASPTRRRAWLSRPLSRSPRLCRVPSRGGRRRAPARVVLGRARRRDSLRRRYERGRWGASRRWTLPTTAPSRSTSVQLRRVLEVDTVSRAARIQGERTGPDLEAQLAEHGLTLRHFPQSFELSTLGGWIATRAAGHFATVWTHIEDLRRVGSCAHARRAPGPRGGCPAPAPVPAPIGCSSAQRARSG